MPPRFSFNTDLTSSVNAPYITALGDMKKTKLDSSWSWCERERESLFPAALVQLALNGTWLSSLYIYGSSTRIHSS
jgi:hypothetical protein